MSDYDPGPEDPIDAEVEVVDPLVPQQVVAGEVLAEHEEDGAGAPDADDQHLVRGSVWILVGLGLQSALGGLFWLLASKVATDGELGRASGLFTGIQFVNYASGLGLTVALARYATGTLREHDELFGWSVLATVASSAVAGALFLVVSDSRATHVVTGSVWGWLGFIVATAGTSVGLLVDVRLMAGRRWGWLIARIAFASLVRLPLAFVDLGRHEAAWLFALMLAPLVVVGFGGLVLLPRIGLGRSRLGRPAALASFSRYAGVNWLATLASQAPQFALPLIVLQNVRSGVYADFFIAWTITGLVFLLPAGISQVLLVEGAKDDEVGRDDAFERRNRQALVFAVGLSALAYVGSLLASVVVVAAFGDAYRDVGRILPSLTLAGIPWAIAAVRLSEARVRHDQLATITITVALGLGILVPALLWLPGHETETVGATRAWLLGNTLAAIVAVLVPRRPGPKPVPARSGVA